MKDYENFSGKSQKDLEQYIMRNSSNVKPHRVLRDVRKLAGYSPSKYMDLLVYAAHIVRGETD